MTSNIFNQPLSVGRSDYNRMFGHHSKVIWLTGLSGSGKSTLASELCNEFYQKNIFAVVLDGDNTRLGLCKDLGFEREERSENIRRVAEVARLFLESGAVVITSLISPLNQDRAMAKEIIGEEDFMEVFVDCSLDTCVSRDVKGLYQKAIQGHISNFTGLGSPYERPESPDVCVNTEELDKAECVRIIMSALIIKLDQTIQLSRD